MFCVYNGVLDMVWVARFGVKVLGHVEWGRWPVEEVMQGEKTGEGKCRVNV